MSVSYIHGNASVQVHYGHEVNYILTMAMLLIHNHLCI